MSIPRDKNEINLNKKIVKNFYRSRSKGHTSTSRAKEGWVKQSWNKFLNKRRGTKKIKKKKDSQILKLGRKSKTRKMDLVNKFNSSTSSGLHPIIKLADESVKKINYQLNQNNNHNRSK